MTENLNQENEDKEEFIFVNATPRTGTSMDELVELLTQVGGKDIEVLSESYLSARLTKATIEKATEHADVERKVKKQFRRKFRR